MGAAVRFGEFELDLDTGELLRSGSPVVLRSQAARVLARLAARAGHLVPRSELIDLLWPDAVVEYDQGLNSVIRQIRRLLGDDPRFPRFIETVPKQGYRFVAVTAPVPGTVVRPARVAPREATTACRRRTAECRGSPSLWR